MYIQPHTYIENRQNEQTKSIKRNARVFYDSFMVNMSCLSSCTYELHHYDFHCS